jgi:hypothetical protein
MKCSGCNKDYVCSYEEIWFGDYSKPLISRCCGKVVE